MPLQLSFPTYNRDEIFRIVSQRLEGNVEPGADPIIKPIAIQFLANKISALSGDVRKALDVCRRAIELADIEARKEACFPVTPSPAKKRRGVNGKQVVPVAAAERKIKSIDLPDLLRIFNEIYSSRVTQSIAANSSNSDLPLQHKVVIATLLVLTRYCKVKRKDVSVGKLQETYSRICVKKGIPNLDVSEVISIVDLLESRGFMTMKKVKGSTREAKVSLRIDEKEVELALQDKALLSAIVDEAATS